MALLAKHIDDLLEDEKEGGIIMYTVNPDISVEYFENEVILVSSDEKIHCLNETASEIWKLVEKNMDIDNIALYLANKYSIPCEDVKKDVMKMLDEFVDKHILVVQ